MSAPSAGKTAAVSGAGTPGNLLLGAGHDFRNALTGLGFAAETAEAELLHGRVDRGLHFVRRIQSGIQRTHRQLSDLLLAQRLQSGLWPVGRRPVALRDLADRVLAHVESESERQRVQVTVKGTGLMELDGDLVELLVRPLVVNALQFSVVPSVVEVHWIGGVAGLEIQVMDRGCGVPEAERGRLFQPFVCLQTAAGVAGGGLGLGLFIARTAAHALGGTADLAARPGGGVIVRVALPGPVSKGADA